MEILAAHLRHKQSPQNNYQVVLLRIRTHPSTLFNPCWFHAAIENNFKTISKLAPASADCSPCRGCKRGRHRNSPISRYLSKIGVFDWIGTGFMKPNVSKAIRKLANMVRFKSDDGIGGLLHQRPSYSENCEVLCYAIQTHLFCRLSIVLLPLATFNYPELYDLCLARAWFLSMATCGVTLDWNISAGYGLMSI